ncbi:MAG: rRNA processing protein RimM [Bacillota bacterium]|jgi:16S rRNA processing protein RimM|nr:rRNA processing protein RimM [Bacillota bacterium]MDK2882157.1 rRNA processing protein RimM [Bacillota bacterium]MDK2960294.1 rRNA processing protein RimM [Bacillota bacterium]
MNRDELVTIGQVTSAHGVRGEMNLALLTDFPERVRRLKRVYLVLGEEVRGPYAVTRARLAGSKAIIKLEGIDTREAAKALGKWEVAVTKDDVVELPPGHYYYFQLVGLPVYTTEGENLGNVVEIIDLPSNDVYVVKNDAGQEILLPATHEVVREINLEDKYLKVYLIPGLR